MNVTILDGKDAIMSCGAVGAPTPNVTWYYKGRYQTGNSMRNHVNRKNKNR